MRARNIKPGFYQNEKLVALPFETRLMFPGLWMLADREGRMEDRPLKIKMQLFPADEVDVEDMLNQLSDAGLIVRYQVDSQRYIYIPAWHKHQNPHVKEKASEIPAPDKHSASTVQEPEKPEPTRLIPDSGYLIPDSGYLIPEVESEFEDFKSAYPKRAGDQGWVKARKAINARLREGHTFGEIIQGAQRYAAYCDAVSNTGTQFVKTAATFVGPEKHFLNLWEPPRNKSERQQDKTISAAREFLEESNAP